MIDRRAIPPPSTSTPCSTRRTDCGSGGRHSGTLIVPRASVMQAIACASTMPGLARSPPQLPEWCPPSRKSTMISIRWPPRAPRNSVGRSGAIRGPSDAIRRSAFRWPSLCCSHSSRNPTEPYSSLISIRNFTLNPSRPRSFSTAARAAMLIECWPLLSAVPRP